MLFVPHTKKQIILLLESGKKQVQHRVSSCFWRMQLRFFLNKKMINGTPFRMWFQIPVFTDSLKLSFNVASDELAESVVTHEILPQLVCANIHRLGVGSRFGKSGPSARVRWDFFLIEMNHLYKMMSLVWLMAFTVWWTHHAAVHFFLVCRLCYFWRVPFLYSSVTIKNVAVVCLFAFCCGERYSLAQQNRFYKKALEDNLWVGWSNLGVLRSLKTSSEFLPLKTWCLGNAILSAWREFRPKRGLIPTYAPTIAEL